MQQMIFYKSEDNYYIYDATNNADTARLWEQGGTPGPKVSNQINKLIVKNHFFYNLNTTICIQFDRQQKEINSYLDTIVSRNPGSNVRRN